MTTANDIAWSRLFSETKLLTKIEQSGFAYVTADELKLHGNREARLMAKFDTLANRPQIFKQNAINLLPVQNGQYVVFSDPDNKSFFCFNTLLEEVSVEQYNSVFDLSALDTLSSSRSFSESQAIDYAFIASLLRYFCQCDSMHLSVRGRLFSGTFDLVLPSSQQTIVVSNVQVEVDSGYESEDSIILIEAKIGRRDDFNIRQLVYPYLQWSKKSKKRIRPIFMTYSNGRYVITEFSIGANFGELEVISNKAFIINDSTVAVVNLRELLNVVAVGTEPAKIPFPQANDLDIVVDVIQFIGHREITKVELAEFLEFEDRQADYYANAAAYLGFAHRKEHLFSLTEEGKEFLNLSVRTQRTRVILKQLLKRPSFRNSLTLLASRKFDLNSVSDAEFAHIIQQEVPLSGTTPARRASAVRKWLKWLLTNSSFVNSGVTE